MPRPTPRWWWPLPWAALFLPLPFLRPAPLLVNLDFSAHHSGYPCNWKHASISCPGLWQWLYMGLAPDSVIILFIAAKAIVARPFSSVMDVKAIFRCCSFLQTHATICFNFSSGFSWMILDLTVPKTSSFNSQKKLVNLYSPLFSLVRMPKISEFTADGSNCV